MANESITVTRRYADGRMVTATYSNEISKDTALTNEKKHQDEKYQERFSAKTEAIIDAFVDLCKTMEWD